MRDDFLRQKFEIRQDEQRNWPSTCVESLVLPSLQQKKDQEGNRWCLWSEYNKLILMFEFVNQKFLIAVVYVTLATDRILLI